MDIMIRKSLQESGEFDEPLLIRTHWKKKKGANATDIFFTAFSTRLYHQILDQAKASEDHILVFPVYAILHKALKHIRHPRPAAVIFQHDRFAEIVIGTPDTIFFAERCVAFDDSGDQISALWNMLESEIRNAEMENRIKVDKVLLLTWIDTKDLPALSEEMQGIFHPVAEQDLHLEDETYSVSFLKAVQMMSGHEAVSSPMEKASYYSRKSLPFMNVFLLFAIILLFSGFLWYGHRADRIEEAIQAKTAAEFQTRAAVSEVPYKETFAFIKELDRFRKTPSFKQVLEDVTEALPGQMTADVLKADYDANMLKIEIFVKTESSLMRPTRAFRAFYPSWNKRDTMWESVNSTPPSRILNFWSYSTKSRQRPIRPGHRWGSLAITPTAERL